MLARRNKSLLGPGWDNLLGEIFGDVYRPYLEDPVNVTYEQDDKNYYVRAVVPGFKDSELNVGIDGNIVTVSGKREKTSEKDGMHSSSRSSFTQSVRLASDAIVDEISAEHRSGILVITIPRRESKKIESKVIPIKALEAPKE